MSFLRVAIVLGRKPSSNLRIHSGRAMAIHRRSIGAAATTYVRRIPNCASPERLAIFRLGPSVVPDRDRTLFQAL